MQTTAKSFLLIDASNINISPVTDLTSLYYEVERDYNGTKILARKYIYSGFPVGVYIDPSTSTYIGSYPVHNYSAKDNTIYKLVEKNTNNDIIVSNISTSIIPGTTYRLLNVKNYNLTEILTHYTTRELFDTSINNINNDILVLDNSINSLYTALHTDVKSLQDIIDLKNSSLLISNKFYLINNYSSLRGCMKLPNANNFSGTTNRILLVRANSSTSLDEKLYEMYTAAGNALKVYGTYKLEDSNSKVHITYMKDQYGNEAPYDFYNLKYKFNNKWHFTFGTNLINSSIQNNIIKTDPYIFGSMPVIYNNDNGECIIKNNYIGYNVLLYCEIPYKNEQIIVNNVIGNNNIIYIGTDYLASLDLNISNCNICNSNIINITGQGSPIFKNIIINSNNNININYISILSLSNVNINSSNNITLYNDAANVTILNNCDGSINLSDNIIVDNYIDAAPNSSLNTSTNSVYLFGQNIYAKSFNTLS